MMLYALISSELKTLEWWILGLMLNPLFFLISRLNIACSPLIFNLQINYPIGSKDIPFKSFQLRTHRRTRISRKHRRTMISRTHRRTRISRTHRGTRVNRTHRRTRISRTHRGTRVTRTHRMTSISKTNRGARSRTSRIPRPVVQNQQIDAELERLIVQNSRVSSNCKATIAETLGITLGAERNV